MALYFPAAHAVQCDAPVTFKSIVVFRPAVILVSVALPAGQVVHTGWPDLANVPTGQVVQCVDCCKPPVERPASQAVHDALPTASLKYPAAQAIHELEAFIFV